MGMLDRIEMALDQIDRHVAAYIATVALQKAYEETGGPQALDVRQLPTTQVVGGIARPSNDTFNIDVIVY